MANISFYGSHNAAYVVEEGGKILLVLEVERFLNYKNSGLAQYMCPKNEDILFLAEYIPKFIMKKFNIDKFENCYFINSDVILDQVYKLEQYIKADNYIHGLHHQSHVAGAFYQSPYSEAIAFSFDGGGNDGKFNVYHCLRGQSPKLLECAINPVINYVHIHYDLGFPYMIFGEYLGDIKKEVLSIGNLVYPGKIMGLASYGNVKEEWLPHFIEFYRSNPNGEHIGPWDESGYNDYEPKIKLLGDNIGVNFNANDRLTGQTAYDVAATSQRAFEECFLSVAKKYMDQYSDLPVIVAGGCGLNILLNTRLVKEFNKKVFVGPNPNDCGIALGLMLNQLKPSEPFDATYSGLELLDLDNLADYIQNVNCRFTTKYVKTSNVVQDLLDGKIIGVARGRAEHGARALGNRSIIADATHPDTYDILNNKLQRNDYMPFAPAVLEQDANIIFDIQKSPYSCEFMTMLVDTKEEYRDMIPTCVHPVDKTARIQIVTRNSNKMFYDILRAYKNVSGIGCLVNTSFNVHNEPIVERPTEAMTHLKNGIIDYLVTPNGIYSIAS